MPHDGVVTGSALCPSKLPSCDFSRGVRDRTGTSCISPPAKAFPTMPSLPKTRQKHSPSGPIPFLPGGPSDSFINRGLATVDFGANTSRRGCVRTDRPSRFPGHPPYSLAPLDSSSE